MEKTEDVFRQVFLENRWLSAESVSGTGSTLLATNELVPQLLEQISRLRIRSLNDAPCGDFNWIRPVAEAVDYRGFDVVPEVLELARSRGQFRFEQLDIVEEALPRADAILCRDCLVHLPIDMITRALDNFVQSGSDWLITTTFPFIEENVPARVGSWRPLNLERAPFNLPPPVDRIVERPSIPSHERFGRKMLGVWKLSDVARARRSTKGSASRSSAPLKRRS